MVTNETDLPTDSAPENEPGPKKPERKRLLLVLAVVIVASVVLFLANREDAGPAEEEGSAELATITDRQGGFSIKLPQHWQFFEQEQSDPEIRMVVGESGTQNNLRVRVSPLAEPVIIDSTTPDTVLAELQAQFDRYIDEGENVREVLQRQRVNINGVQGWWYLYSFNDSRGSEEGLHSHFFLLGGSKMYVLVFQVLPTSAYGNYARTFDEIITSFRLTGSESTSPAPSPAE